MRASAYRQTGSQITHHVLGGVVAFPEQRILQLRNPGIKLDHRVYELVNPKLVNTMIKLHSCKLRHTRMKLDHRVHKLGVHKLVNTMIN